MKEYQIQQLEQEKVDRLLSTYGDLLSLMSKLQKGENLNEIKLDKLYKVDEAIEEHAEKAPTEHDEMQWRLIRLGLRAKLDVWIPKNDQSHKYHGERFKDLVIPEFRKAIDVPQSIENIDTVWKLGYSIKSAFEIEHSTQIFSGILRLSDLRVEAPNSNYPLFIVADRSKKSRVLSQLERPTFSSNYLQLNKAVKFLSYDRVRELDKQFTGGDESFDLSWLVSEAEFVN